LNGYQAASHALAFFFCNEQHPVFWHGVLHALKKVATEVGRVAVLKIGLCIAFVKEIPIGGLNGLALKARKCHASFAHFAAFLSDFFAFFLAETRQEMLKVGMAVVMPMKLYGVTAEPPSSFCGLPIVL